MTTGTSITVVLLTFLVIYSCRKTSLEPVYNVGKPNDLSLSFQASIQQAFTKGNYQTQNLTTKVNDSLQLIWKPDWSQLQEKVISDTLNYLYIPLNGTFYNSKNKSSIMSTFSNFKKYLIVKLNSVGMHFYAGDYLPDSALPNGNKPLKKDVLSNFSFNNFTGSALVKDLDGTGITHRISYNKGKINSFKANSNTKTNSNPKLRADDIQDCYIDHYNCEWAELYQLPCIEYGTLDDPYCTYSAGGLYTDYSDGCQYTLSQTSDTPVTECQTIYLPDLPPDPPLVSGNDAAPKTTPCAQKVAVNQRATNATLAAQNSQILSHGTTYEYGVNQNLTSLSGSTYKSATPASDQPPSTHTWTPNYTWDSASGYTIGTAHNHPGDTPPSPQDVLTMLNIFGVHNFQIASSSDKQFYQENASITVLTPTETFVVTVNDWNDLNIINQAYNSDPTKFLRDYGESAVQYQTDNPNSSTTDCYEYALKKTFGSAINLYQAATGSTNFTPREISSSATMSNMQCQ